MADEQDAALREAVAAAETVEGLLRTDEIRLLFLAAARPTGEGEVLEIGSYKGRSTVALARGALYAGQERVVGCDPFTSPASTDLVVGRETYEAFSAALERHGLTDHVEVHQQCSGELAASWARPIRLLWIDGDHTYEGVKRDVEGFFPYLVKGAVVAFHDIGRQRFPGATRCFIEDVVLSDGFGACGVTDYTAWAQYVSSGGLESQREAKSVAFRLLSARLGQQLFGARPGPLTRYRFHRFRRGRSFERWIASAHTVRVGQGAQRAICLGGSREDPI